MPGRGVEKKAGRVSAVAGIDYDASGVFIVLADENTGRFVKALRADLACGPGDSFQRARRVRPLMPTWGMWDDWGVTGIAIELPFSRFAASLVPLMRVQGAIIATLPRDVEVVELRPQTWKKHTVGKSNASKDEVRAWALEQGAPAGLVGDLYDGFGLARAYLAISEKEAAAA